MKALNITMMAALFAACASLTSVAEAKGGGGGGGGGKSSHSSHHHHGHNFKSYGFAVYDAGPVCVRWYKHRCVAWY
jgi:hypothetical protein